MNRSLGYQAETPTDWSDWSCLGLLLTFYSKLLERFRLNKMLSCVKATFPIRVAWMSINGCLISPILLNPSVPSFSFIPGVIMHHGSRSVNNYFSIEVFLIYLPDFTYRFKISMKNSFSPLNICRSRNEINCFKSR